MLEASLVLWLWAAKTWLHLIVFGYFPFSVEINILPYQSEKLKTFS
jgi:hypothetical protein